MKNVTIALDDEVHRKARIRAAELGTSLSALVKDYLTGLSANPGLPVVAGPVTGEVREMPAAFNQAASVADGPPWLVNGKWVYTRDGKPRQPGSLRGKFKGQPDDGDEWPPEMLEFFEKLQNDPWDDDQFDPLP